MDRVAPQTSLLSTIALNDLAPFLLAIDVPVSPLTDLEMFDEQFLVHQVVSGEQGFANRSSGLSDEAFSKIDMDVDFPLSLCQKAAGTNTYAVNESALGPKSTKAESLAKRQMDYRTMKKVKLLELRATSKLLAARCGELRAKRRPMANALHRLSSKDGQVSGWKNTAMCEIQQRYEAEALNRDLRTQVRAHQALIQHLSNSMQQQVRLLDSERAERLVAIDRLGRM